jgi:hypothetical protein
MVIVGCIGGIVSCIIRDKISKMGEREIKRLTSSVQKKKLVGSWEALLV